MDCGRDIVSMAHDKGLCTALLAGCLMLGQGTISLLARAPESMLQQLLQADDGQPEDGGGGWQPEWCISNSLDKCLSKPQSAVVP